MIAILFAIFIIPICEIRRDLIVLKELSLLHRAGMCETADIIVERAYEK